MTRHDKVGLTANEDKTSNTLEAFKTAAELSTEGLRFLRKEAAKRVRDHERYGVPLTQYRATLFVLEQEIARRAKEEQ
jgi:hypothetical protein